MSDLCHLQPATYAGQILLRYSFTRFHYDIESKVEIKLAHTHFETVKKLYVSLNDNLYEEMKKKKFYTIVKNSRLIIDHQQMFTNS